MKHSFFFLFLIFILPQNTVAYAADGISREEAVSIAQQHNPGRVLAVKKKANIYKVKTLSDSGKVRVIQIDATSGRVNPRATTKTHR